VSPGQASALQGWLDGLPSGATAIIAPGTYVLTTALRIAKPVTLWGYGAKLQFNGTGTSETSGGLYVTASDVRILGVEIAGNATKGATKSAWSGEPGERPHGISLIGKVRDIEIADTYIHDVKGDGIYKSAWTAHESDTTSGGFWVHHNRISRTGRQGIVNNLGVPTSKNPYGWKIERNELWDIALYPVDAEDSKDTGQRLDTVIVADNDFLNWNWEANASFNNRAHAIYVGYKAGPDGEAHVAGRTDHIHVLRNTFRGGPMGFGGVGHADQCDPNGGVVQIRTNSPTIPNAPKNDVRIEGNLVNVPQALRCGRFATVADANGVVISGNTFPGMTVQVLRSTNVSGDDAP
jgi:hypothetical protein